MLQCLGGSAGGGGGAGGGAGGGLGAGAEAHCTTSTGGETGPSSSVGGAVPVCVDGEQDVPRSAALPQSQSGGAGDARVASFPRWIANQQPAALVVVPFARRKVVFAHVILGRP